MKSMLNNIRNTVLAGILFLVPVFVIFLIFQRTWNAMTGLGQQLANLLGLKTVAGAGAASISTTLVLLILFYLCGLLVRFAMITRMRDWIENNLLQHMPGYMKYKVKMEEKLLPTVNTWQAVLVRIQNAWKPGFVMERNKGHSVVFTPATPDTDIGEVWVVDDQDLQALPMNAKEFKASLQHSGRGLAI